MNVFALLLTTLLALPAPHATFDAGFAKVERFGNPQGRPVIFIPGLACGPWVWGNQIAALAPRYDLYVLSLPGFDGQPMVTGDDLMKRAVDSVHDVIVSQHLRRAIVVGHSLGGTISVMFAQTYPHDASLVVSVEGGYPEAPTQAERNAAVARETKPYEGIPAAQLGSALRTNMLQYTITSPADVDRATELAGRSDPAAIVAWMRAALLLDLTPGLTAIAAPFTEIIPYDAQIDPYRGFKTQDAKLQAYRQWVAHVPNGNVVLIPNARHFVMIDQPSAFEAALHDAFVRADALGFTREGFASKAR